MTNVPVGPDSRMARVSRVVRSGVGSDLKSASACISVDLNGGAIDPFGLESEGFTRPLDHQHLHDLVRNHRRKLTQVAEPSM